MSDPVRFGFLGAGWIAHRALGPAVHAADGAVLQAAAARDVTRASTLEPRGLVYNDYPALLADPSVDVVYISLSNESHKPWTLAALEAGKHVLCEKPIGLDAAEVEVVTAAARAADRLLVEAFWYRWHPRTRALEDLVSRGALGRIDEVETDFSFAGDWRDDRLTNYRLDPTRGGGALYDVGCYAISAAQVVLGPALSVEDVETVTGPTGVDLATTAWLRVEDDDDGGHLGARALVRCGIDIPDRQVVRVAGEEATADFAQGEAFSNWHAPSTLAITTRDGAVHVTDFAPVDPYRLMVEAVAARIRGEDSFLVGLDHSASIAATSDAVRAVAASGLGRNRTM